MSAAARLIASKTWIVRGSLLAVGVGFLVAYLTIVLLRIRYPFELEWMEGGMVDHVRRVLEGKPIYAKPSLEFVSFLYPPLYYYVSALVASVTGLGFFPLRLVAFASSLGVIFTIFAIVRRECGRIPPALLAATLYAATFERSAGWFDIARADSFFLFLVLTVVYLLRFGSSRRSFAAAGVVLVLAALTKQSALLIGLPLALVVAWLRRPLFLYFAVPAVVLLAGSLFALDQLHDGWFRYYCLEVPRHHPTKLDWSPGDFVVSDLGPLAIALAASIGWLGARLRSPERETGVFYAAFAVGMLGSSWAVRSAVGAEANNLFSAYAALSILTGLAFHALGRAARRRGGSYAVAEAGFCLLLLIQFALLSYDPRKHVPTPADLAAGQQLVELLRGIEGEVYIPHHGYLAVRAGKASHAHTLAMDNLLLPDASEAARDLWDELLEALAERRFSAVVVESDRRYLPEIQTHYRMAAALFGRPDVFIPVTGGPLRPEYLFVPR